MANLSDLAAMGAAPRYLLISLAIPPSTPLKHIEGLYSGMMKACRRHDVSLIGGDTSASAGGLFLSITLLGDTPRGRALFRTGARVGDGIYVTGTLGDSLAGLELLRKTPRTAAARQGLTDRHRQFLLARHLRPTARVDTGQWLNRGRLATAAIDVSDGLSGDLRHLCEDSKVGADIDAARIPVSAAGQAYARSVRQDPVQLALAGGEDYELLFTVSPRQRAVVERQANRRGVRITRIGTIRPRRTGMRLMSPDGSVRPLPITSYEHFRT